MRYLVEMVPLLSAVLRFSNDLCPTMEASVQNLERPR